MGRSQSVAALAEAMGVDETFLLEACDLRRARNGSLYLQVVLSDRTGKVEARKWDARAEDAEGMEPGIVVRARGFVESYRGRPQIILRSLDVAPPGDAVAADFLPASARPAASMLAELREVLGTVSHPSLRALLDAFFDDADFLERFCASPAAVKLHHAAVGGLLEHTLACTRCAEAVAGLYPGLNRDVLLCGAFLHDVGKIEELSSEGVLAYTDRGKLLGHITLGVSLLEAKAGVVPGFPKALLDALTHLVLSHHGRTEFGSPKLPMTAEAVVLSLLDDLDAKVNAVASLREGERKGNWTEYVRGFDRAFFVGDPDAEVDGGA